MTLTQFYKIEEVKLSRKEKRDPHPSFGVTCSPETLRGIVKDEDLYENYLWGSLEETK